MGLNFEHKIRADNHGLERQITIRNTRGLRALGNCLPRMVDDM